MKDDIDIFIFGDSITYGVGDNEKCGWVNRFRLNLEKNYNRTFNVFNLGISGDTTEGVKKRFDSEFNTRKDKDNETFIIFSIGVNDTQDINGKDRVNIEQFGKNISYLINKAKEYSNNIIFLGFSLVDETKVVPLPWNKEKSYFNRKIEIFDNKLMEICNKSNITYLNIYNLLTINDLSDGIHPNSNGHQKICDEITKLFKNLL